MILAQLLETTEAKAHYSIIKYLTKFEEERNSQLLEDNGVLAFYVKSDSPLNRCFGLGFSPDFRQQLDLIESFYNNNHSPVSLEIYPNIDNVFKKLLKQRNYVLQHHTNVFLMSLSSFWIQVKQASNLSVFEIDTRSANIWAQTSADGWINDVPHLYEFIFRYGLSSVNCSLFKCFLAKLNGKSVGTGSLFLNNEIALLMNASIILEHRNKGIYPILINKRIEAAFTLGAKYVMICTNPESTTNLTLNKIGFKFLYQRENWKRAQ